MQVEYITYPNSAVILFCGRNKQNPAWRLSKLNMCQSDSCLEGMFD